MGSTRSWVADMEDEDTTCKYGVVSKYFDDCRCEGCKADRVLWGEVLDMSNKIKYIAIAFFSKTPREDWDKVVSLRIKKD